MKYTKYLAFVLVSASLAACGSSNNTAQYNPPLQQNTVTVQPDNASSQINRLPDWYLNLPEDNSEYLYTVASGKSVDRETARQMAMTNAAAEMARKLSQKVQALQKIFTNTVTSGGETNFDQAFTNASKTIANERLQGLSTDKMTFVPANQGSQLECIVLVKLPIGKAKDALTNTLARDKELFVKFKESKAFEELEADINKLEEKAAAYDN